MKVKQLACASCNVASAEDVASTTCAARARAQASLQLGLRFGPTELKVMFDVIDADKSGRIDQKEFTEWWLNAHEGTYHDTLCPAEVECAVHVCTSPCAPD